MGRLARMPAFALTVALATGLANAQTSPNYADLEPILRARCVMCHASAAPSAGLALDGIDALLAGSARGPVVVPDDPDTSELVRRLRGESLPRMPLTGPPYLSDEEIDLVVAWVADGARDADGTPAPLPVGAEVRLHGIWLADDTLDGLPLDLAGARIDDDARRGAYVQVRGVLAADGRVVVERVRGR